MSVRERWWHAFVSEEETEEWGAAHVTMILGATSLHPEQLLAKHGPTLRTETGFVLNYARSWDHEPTEAEKDALIPDEEDEVL